MNLLNPTRVSPQGRPPAAGRPFRLLAMAVAGALAGCSALPEELNPVEWVGSVDSYLSGEDTTPDAEQAARVEAERAQPVPGADADFPSLGRVPGEAPTVTARDERDRIADELIADRAATRYVANPAVDSFDAVARPAPPPGAAVSAAAAPTVTSEPALPTVDLDAAWLSAVDQLEADTAPAAAAPATASGGMAEDAGSMAEDAMAPARRPVPVVPTPPARSPSAAMPESPPAAMSDMPMREVPMNEMPMHDAPMTAAPMPAAPMPAAHLAGAAMPGTGARHVGVIHYAYGSTRLSPADKEVLRGIAREQQAAGAMLSVVGHSSGRVGGRDPVAAKIANFAVAEDRARKVAEELIRLGVPADRILVSSRADTEPLYSEATRNGEAANRRTDIYLGRFGAPG